MTTDTIQGKSCMSSELMVLSIRLRTSWMLVEKLCDVVYFAVVQEVTRLFCCVLFELFKGDCACRRDSRASVHGAAWTVLLSINTVRSASANALSLLISTSYGFDVPSAINQSRPLYRS